MPTIFLTGFPGFLGSALVERLLDRSPQEVSITCLIQPRWRGLAEQKAYGLERQKASRLGRIHLVEGDITRPGLGLGEAYAQLQYDTQEVYHLAAVYDLSVKREFAFRVNVEGSRNVLDFAEGCNALARFQYVSTCYISGRYEGLFTESDLEKGQIFNNFYEETKYFAEVEVQRRMKAGLPVSIYRPGIVVGDSKTGQTQKYDGPYAILRFLMNQLSVAVMPVIGDTSRYTVNIVPQDFVIEAIAHLSAQNTSLNKVYQLANPNPPSVAELIDLFAGATKRWVLPVSLPKVIAKSALEYVPYAQDLTGITTDAVEYFTHPTTYSCENTLRDLKETNIACPPLEAYVGTLVQYVQAHPDISAKAMI
ncbi:MAG TPA: SDR family oxidoreductase [Rhodothermales bacterium]|nr:SDR family oxidoreductase [Rhodothermales bacterium]